MGMRLKDKVAIITGAARGIGAATARLFANEGAIVYATDIDEGSFESGTRFLKHDVSREDEWIKVVSQVESEQGKLSILINNAGLIGTYESIDTISMDDYNRVVAINQTGVFLGIRHCVTLMRKSGGGSIVNLSSIWGSIGAAGVAAYQASKGAVTVITKNAALTYAPRIRANSIHPGLIHTRLADQQDDATNQALIDMTPLKRMGKPEEIAYAALFLASDESAYVTGTELFVDGGYSAQ
jgi:NAD(P)-dependent dehydrogenase (short-subunit alcohol dehydrogenase family)